MTDNDRAETEDEHYLTAEFCKQLVDHYIERGIKYYPFPVIGGHPENHHITTGDVMEAQQNIIASLTKALTEARNAALEEAAHNYQGAMADIDGIVQAYVEGDCKHFAKYMDMNYGKQMQAIRAKKEG